MGLGKKAMDWGGIAATSIALEAFQVRLPSEVEECATVGAFIDYITRERGLTRNTIIRITLEPSFEEVREEAFRRLQEEVIAVGGNVPQEVDSNISVEELVPVKNRHVSWSKLATGLQCELPNFDNPKWAMWFSMLITYPFVCVFMVLLLMPILMLLGIAEEAPWYIMIILGPFVFIATLFLGVVTANKAESLLFRHPMRIPFDSIGEFTTYIALNARGIKDSLRKQVSTSIDTYVRQVVAKEFGRTPGQIDDKFKLVPSSEP